MRFEKLIRAFGQALGEAMAENGKFRFEFDADNDSEWSTFDEIPLEGSAPSKLKVSLGRRDVVRVGTGDRLTVLVDGEDADALRFRRDGDTLRIRRQSGGKGALTIGITMPAPESITVGGAGTVEAQRLAAIARVAIGGSGTIRVESCAADLVTAKIGGSGRIELGGRAETLELAIGGSGHFISPDLEVDLAKICIGGSGTAEFASDGEVEARIGGSGNIRVHGQPRCSLKAGGSGTLVTVPRGADKGAGPDTQAA